MSSPRVYRITVQGYLCENWSDIMGDMAVVTTPDEDRGPVTTLTGEMVDQAMLLGVLNYIYDLNLPLIQVQLLDEQGGHTT
jgi:hypothetical protein